MRITKEGFIFETMELSPPVLCFKVCYSGPDLEVDTRNDDDTDNKADQAGIVHIRYLQQGCHFTTSLL